jgi:hypothetical protein
MRGEMNGFVLRIDAHTLLLPLAIVVSIAVARVVAHLTRSRRPARTLRVVSRASSRARRAA